MSFVKFDTMDQICNITYDLEKTHEDKILKMGNRPPRVEDYGDYGLSAAGTRFGFPARFVSSLYNEGHEDLANDIVKVKTKDYLESGRPVLLRKWDDKIEGALTDKYGIFDDKEVVNILSKSDYLKNSAEIWFSEDPGLFHARFISENKLYLDGDDSPLSMAVFVDNSMIGLSSFKVRFGIYRWACTNGLITGLKSFEIMKQIHKSGAQFGRDLNIVLKEVPQYEEMLMDMVRDMADAKSSIYGLTLEQAKTYLKAKLGASEKLVGDVYDKYLEYGGVSRWDLCNAITETARDLSNFDRLKFESLALAVA